MEVTNRIMENRLKISEKSSFSLSKIPNLMLKLYHCLMKQMNENYKNSEYHFKYNHLSHFNFVNVFCDHYVKAYERIKTSEDVMNRSIFKIHETNKTLSDLKEKIVEMEP